MSDLHPSVRDAIVRGNEMDDAGRYDEANRAYSKAIRLRSGPTCVIVKPNGAIAELDMEIRSAWESLRTALRGYHDGG